MATLNYAFKEISCKIVYYGCGLCGKTTNLIHVHKTVPGKFRGELVSLATEQDRTLFFDFLPLDLGEVKGFKTKFQLYTVPGQVYYNATRKLVLRGVDGLVFVVDSQKDRLQENVESFENLRQNLQEYGYHLQMGKEDSEGIPWVLQLNKRDMPHISDDQEIIEALQLGGKNIPVIEAVAVNGAGVKETLKGISSLVIQKLNTGQGSVPAPEPKKEEAPKPAAPAEAPAAAAAPAAAEQPAAPAPPAQPEAAPPAEPPKKPEPAPDTAAASGPPVLAITQPSDARWHGSKTGGGTLSLTNIEGENEYQLTGALSFLGVFKRTFSTKLTYKGVDQKTFNGQEAAFHLFESSAGQDGPSLNVSVQNGGNKLLYLTYNGFGGEINVLPSGQKVMP